MAQHPQAERSPQPSSGLRVESAGAVTTLILDRPERLNSLDRELSLALISAVDSVGQDPTCRCLVITGAGRAFCAGQYLGKEGENELPEDVAQLIRERYTPLVLGLRRLRIPAVVAPFLDKRPSLDTMISFPPAGDLLLSRHVRYHVTDGVHRATITLPSLLTEYLAIALGQVPHTPAAIATKRIRDRYWLWRGAE
ncbi:MAG: enoyl-CoA hydratase-related protein [Candidatus Dormibacteria bacterium]